MVEEIKLELMDWKAVEKSAEEALRRAKMEIILHRLTLIRAKKEIKKLGGKTSAEEIKEEKDERKDD